MAKKVIVEEYNPAWPQEFQRIKDMLESILRDTILGIEHVGSTSVPGLAAKPVIDINVVMAGYHMFGQIKARLKEAGFVHEGDLGIEGREAFARTFQDEFMGYHLYVCPQEGEALKRQIMFRDYLRGNPAARDQYGALKKALAQEHTWDVDTYCNKKRDFVLSILEQTLKSQ